MRNAYAVRRPVVNAYLVRERDRNRLRELGWVLLVFAPLALAAIGYVWLHIQATRTGYRVQQLELELDSRHRTERHYLLEASHLSSPPRIEQRARRELGMSTPILEQVVFAEEEW